MKNEKGVSLISLIIYVIAMSAMIAVMSLISTFFYKNTKEIRDVSPMIEYSRFNSFFTTEVNKSGVTVKSSAADYVVLKDGTTNIQYTFVQGNKGIYRSVSGKNVKICRGVAQCVFTKGTSNGKTTINVKIKMENETDVREITYTLR